MQYIRDIEKMVLSMIQPDPLPGSYRHDTAGIQEIVDHALRETEMVAENHFDGIIVQNMNVQLRFWPARLLRRDAQEIPSGDK